MKVIRWLIRNLWTELFSIFNVHLFFCISDKSTAKLWLEESIAVVRCLLQKDRWCPAPPHRYAEVIVWLIRNLWKAFFSIFNVSPGWPIWYVTFSSVGKLRTKTELIQMLWPLYSPATCDDWISRFDDTIIFLYIITIIFLNIIQEIALKMAPLLYSWIFGKWSNFGGSNIVDLMFFMNHKY